MKFHVCGSPIKTCKQLNNLKEYDDFHLLGKTCFPGCSCQDGKYLNELNACVNKSHRVCRSGSWVNVSPTATAICRTGFIHYDVRLDCNTTCDNYDRCWTDRVICDGCVCQDGRVIDENGKCIDPLDCPCRYNNTLYKPGEIAITKSTKCTCKEKKWICEDKEDYKPTCSLYGDIYYTRFDGLHKTDRGLNSCAYSVVVTDDAFDELGNCSTLKISAQNLPCGQSGIICSKVVTIEYGPHELILTRGKSSTINGVEVDLSSGVHKTIFVTLTYNHLMTLLLFNNGLYVLYDGATRVYINLPKCYKHHVNGLCGKFDDEEDDLDLTTKWKVDPTCPEQSSHHGHECENDEAKQSWATSTCSLITTGEMFASCRLLVDYRTFHAHCIAASCSCEIGRDCECTCTSISNFAKACASQDICVEWRSNDLCPIMCPEAQHYEPCGNPIIHTCHGNLTKGSALISKEEAKVEGCYCSKGQILNSNGRCVKKESCDCVHEGIKYPSGTTPNIGCRECICHDGELECNTDNCTRCDDDDDSFLCSDVDGTCISKSLVCDGFKDCDGGADEKNCSASCLDRSISIFCQPTQECLPKTFVCDGEVDCVDGSDEANCTNCLSNFFRCSMSDNCLPKEYKCDGIADCSAFHKDDTSDEDGCSIVTGCLYGGTAYANGTKLTVDCMECVCNNTKFECQGQSCKKCDDEDYPTLCSGIKGDCLARSMICDGNEDCEHGDDEQNCTSIVTLKPKLVTVPCKPYKLIEFGKAKFSTIYGTSSSDSQKILKNQKLILLLNERHFVVYIDLRFASVTELSVFTTNHTHKNNFLELEKQLRSDGTKRYISYLMYLVDSFSINFTSNSGFAGLLKVQLSGCHHGDVTTWKPSLPVVDAQTTLGPRAVAREVIQTTQSSTSKEIVDCQWFDLMESQSSRLKLLNYSNNGTTERLHFRLNGTFLIHSFHLEVLLGDAVSVYISNSTVKDDVVVFDRIKQQDLQILSSSPNVKVTDIKLEVTTKEGNWKSRIIKILGCPWPDDKAIQSTAPPYFTSNIPQFSTSEFTNNLFPSPQTSYIPPASPSQTKGPPITRSLIVTTRRPVVSIFSTAPSKFTKPRGSQTAGQSQFTKIQRSTMVSKSILSTKPVSSFLLPIKPTKIITTYEQTSLPQSTSSRTFSIPPNRVTSSYQPSTRTSINTPPSIPLSTLIFNPSSPFDSSTSPKSIFLQSSQSHQLSSQLPLLSKQTTQSQLTVYQPLLPGYSSLQMSPSISSVSRSIPQSASPSTPQSGLSSVPQSVPSPTPQSIFPSISPSTYISTKLFKQTSPEISQSVTLSSRPPQMSSEYPLIPDTSLSPKKILTTKHSTTHFPSSSLPCQPINLMDEPLKYFNSILPLASKPQEPVVYHFQLITSSFINSIFLDVRNDVSAVVYISNSTIFKYHIPWYDDEDDDAVVTNHTLVGIPSTRVDNITLMLSEQVSDWKIKIMGCPFTSDFSFPISRTTELGEISSLTLRKFKTSKLHSTYLPPRSLSSETIPIKTEKKTSLISTSYSSSSSLSSTTTTSSSSKEHTYQSSTNPTRTTTHPPCHPVDLIADTDKYIDLINKSSNDEAITYHIFLKGTIYIDEVVVNGLLNNKVSLFIGNSTHKFVQVPLVEDYVEDKIALVAKSKTKVDDLTLIVSYWNDDNTIKIMGCPVTSVSSYSTTIPSSTPQTNLSTDSTTTASSTPPTTTHSCHRIDLMADTDRYIDHVNSSINNDQLTYLVYLKGGYYVDEVIVNTFAGNKVSLFIRNSLNNFVYMPFLREEDNVQGKEILVAKPQTIIDKIELIVSYWDDDNTIKIMGCPVTSNETVTSINTDTPDLKTFEIHPKILPSDGTTLTYDHSSTTPFSMESPTPPPPCRAGNLLSTGAAVIGKSSPTSQKQRNQTVNIFFTDVHNLIHLSIDLMNADAVSITISNETHGVRTLDLIEQKHGEVSHFTTHPMFIIDYLSINFIADLGFEALLNIDVSGCRPEITQTPTRPTITSDTSPYSVNSTAIRPLPSTTTHSIPVSPCMPFDLMEDLSSNFEDINKTIYSEQMPLLVEYLLPLKETFVIYFIYLEILHASTVSVSVSNSTQSLVPMTLVKNDIFGPNKYLLISRPASQVDNMTLQITTNKSGEWNIKVIQIIGCPLTLRTTSPEQSSTAKTQTLTSKISKEDDKCLIEDIIDSIGKWTSCFVEKDSNPGLTLREEKCQRDDSVEEGVKVTFDCFSCNCADETFTCSKLTGEFRKHFDSCSILNCSAEDNSFHDDIKTCVCPNGLLSQPSTPPACECKCTSNVTTEYPPRSTQLTLEPSHYSEPPMSCPILTTPANSSPSEDQCSLVNKNFTLTEDILGTSPCFNDGNTTIDIKVCEGKCNTGVRLIYLGFEEPTVQLIPSCICCRTTEWIDREVLVGCPGSPALKVLVKEAAACICNGDQCINDH